MGKKIIYFFSVIIITLNSGCNKDRCNDSPMSYPINYVALPTPYETWFSAISVSNPDSQTFYVAKSNDSLIQSFIQQFDYFGPTNNWLTNMPEGSPCGNSIGSNRIFTMSTSLYPMSPSSITNSVQFGIRYPGNPNSIDFYLRYYAYTRDLGYYSETVSIDFRKATNSFIRVFNNDKVNTTDTINLYPINNYKNYFGLEFQEVYIFNFDGSKHINDDRYPLYIVLSTKYGVVEFKEKSGKIWSVSKI